ncbi:MAG: TraR/DksA C4-type zinc finger protein [Thermodesulfobacteriota bacterium]
MEHAAVLGKLISIRDHALASTQNGLKTMSSGDLTKGVGSGREEGDCSAMHLMNYLSIRRMESSQDIVKQIDSALLRLREGTYGVCSRCCEEITSGRLQCIPFAKFCVSCQEIVDRNGGSSVDEDEDEEGAAS